MVRDEQGNVPESVRMYMRRNEETTIRVCEQVDLGTETYAALGPVTKVGDVCFFTRTQISPPAEEAPGKVRYMVRADGACPNHESSLYVPAHNMSEADFAALAKFLDELASSDQAFAAATTGLPDDQRDSAALAPLRQQVGRMRRVPVILVAKLQDFLGIWSVFEVHATVSYDDDRIFVLRVRKLFGRMTLTAVVRGNT